MKGELEKEGELYECLAYLSIKKRFGEAFLFDGGISGDVLNEFNKLTLNGVIWERGDHLWRKRNRGF